MLPIRLIALDLDGTVFDDQKRISPRTLAAIQAALEQGVMVLPATGRNLRGVPKEFLEMPGVRYALTSNGATVSVIATGRRLVNLPFDPVQAQKVYDAVQPFDCMMSIFIDGDAYTSRENDARTEQYAPPELLPYFRNSRHVVDDIHAFMQAHADGIEKFSILYKDEATRDAAWAAATAAAPVEATTSVALNLELNAPGVNKGRGLMTLAKELGLAPEQVMACGDSGNDLEMVRMAGLGVAMANATEPVKAVAKYITADNNHDGVAQAIEKFVLNS